MTIKETYKKNSIIDKVAQRAATEITNMCACSRCKLPVDGSYMLIGTPTISKREYKLDILCADCASDLQAAMRKKPSRKKRVAKSAPEIKVEVPKAKQAGKVFRYSEAAYMEASENGEGRCVACGAEAFNVEPDARKYTCECCDEKAVYGLEELLIMGAIEFK